MKILITISILFFLTVCSFVQKEIQKIPVETKNIEPIQDDKKINVNNDQELDLEIINDIEDCKDLYNAEYGYTIESNFQNVHFITKIFSGHNNKVGWCLFQKNKDDHKLVGFGDNYKGINPIAFVQNRYLIFTESCGSPCQFIRALNTKNYEDIQDVGFSVYYEISDDQKWLIEYDHSLYGRNITNEYLAKAIDLSNFEKKYDFY